MNLLLRGRCVTSTLADRCTAIRNYVRAPDLTGRVRVVPSEPGLTPASSVARCMRDMFANGALRYIQDPPAPPGEPCDFWRPVRETFENGGGDCLDLSVVTAAVCDLIGLSWTIVVGSVHPHTPDKGHAWIEGTDNAGWFLIESTSPTDNLIRYARPNLYKRVHLLSPTMCEPAPEWSEQQARARQTARQPYIPWGPYQGGR
jgi:hypothetical protein